MIFRKLILLFFIQISFAQEIDKDLIKDSVESEINDTDPGLILNIFSEKNNLNFSYAYGINDLAQNNFLENDSQFRIASVTKTFVAATVLRLWEENKLELDDPISYHIERNIYDYLIDGGYNPEIITVRNLLNHSAGLFDHTTHPNFFKKLFENPSYKWTREAQIKACVDWGKPVGLPGQQMKYSDTGYVILGGIIEKLHGKNLDKSMSELLNFNELNITDTWFEDDRNDKRIHQYFRNGTDAYNFDKSMDYFGGGGLISTASDISKFFYLLFNNKVFKYPQTLDEMLKKYSYSTPSQMDYSLGIWEINIDGIKLYTHSGFWGTQVVYSPKHNLSISANYSKGWRGGMNAPIIKKVLKLIK